MCFLQILMQQLGFGRKLDLTTALYYVLCITVVHRLEL